MNHVVNEPTGLFQRCPFDSTVIILCIRWYLTYKRSYRDVVAIMAERNVDVVYTTIMRATAPGGSAGCLSDTSVCTHSSSVCELHYNQRRYPSAVRSRRSVGAGD